MTIHEALAQAGGRLASKGVPDAAWDAELLLRHVLGWDRARLLAHVHVANPRGRVYPSNADEADYGPFFAYLCRLGYTGGVRLSGGLVVLGTSVLLTLEFAHDPESA